MPRTMLERVWRIWLSVLMAKLSSVPSVIVRLFITDSLDLS